MDKQQLEKMVNDGLSSYKIAKQIGKSKTTVRYWLAKFELGTKRIRRCRDCEDTDLSHFFPGRYTECIKCRRKRQNERSRKNKNTLVQYKGGKCVKCGYNKCLAALDFHHLNSDEKDPNWKKMKNWDPDRVKKEVDKCILVCRNCHSEIHYDIQGIA